MITIPHTENLKFHYTGVVIIEERFKPPGGGKGTFIQILSIVFSAMRLMSCLQ